MFNFPSKHTVECIRKQYPPGTRVTLVYMNDPYSTLMPGDQGTVDFVDDTGTIFCTWDNGSSLGVVYGEDAVRKVSNNKEETKMLQLQREIVRYGQLIERTDIVREDIGFITTKIYEYQGRYYVQLWENGCNIHFSKLKARGEL